ncbi:Hypothetical predicted protein [Olea europaea subsp. europaea]|uniref:Uncharacterized protein n=1 Tax=Olea europaea subsp. europaea TaxID=158383 RepID=A0A8S0VCW2_OLEEU|nr:Hypothetical predicted protein [Olea europaea subsp. europaea]
MKIQDQNKETPNEEKEKSNAQEKEERQSEEQSNPSLPKEWRFGPSHPKELIIGDPSKGPSTLPFERDDGEEDDQADDTPLVPSPPHDIPGSSAPPPSSSLTFTKDHYNLLNGRLDSLTSSVDGIGGMLHQLQVQQDTIQAQQAAM